jgi:AraC-like DNA-binding protein
MFDWHPAATDLHDWVSGYWHVVDAGGLHAAEPIRTAPSVGTILTLHMGNANRCADGTIIPATSVLGPQRSVRTWYSQPGTELVMAMLTPSGAAALFPTLAGCAVDNPVDVAAFAGDRLSTEFAQIVSQGRSRSDTVVQLDTWFRRRLAGRRDYDTDLFLAAYPRIIGSGAIAAAASHVGVSVRQLQRISARLTGLSPKELFDIERLRCSVAATQIGEGDPLAGYADQSHQIRAWKRRLDTTPSAYRRESISTIRRSMANPRARLHYL